MNILITGGIGFIGTNTAKFFSEKYPHDNIFIVDNFSRKGVSINAEHLRDNYRNITIRACHIADIDAYLDLIKKVDVIIHLAGQTAVTTSITDPVLDFETNVVGSFRLLEAVRTHNPRAIILYSSTNKVYGDLSHHNLLKNEEKRIYENLTCPNGVDESEPLAFISPYGCSKGSMDEYMKDYSRIYGVKTIIFRQSCIYGRFQMGVEDQGWVAHFSKQFLKNQPIVVYGDGLQVRDLLFVDDLVLAYDKAINQADKNCGKAFNIGGGVKNSYSLIQVIDILSKKIGITVPISYTETRVGDQNYFVSKNEKVEKDLDWKVQTSFEDGIDKMIDWQKEYISVI